MLLGFSPPMIVGGRLSICAGWRLIFYLLMGSVMYGKRQSDNHDDDHEEFVIGHDHHLPLYGRVKAKRHLFLPAGSHGLHRYL